MVVAFPEIFWIEFILYVGGGELRWLSRVPRLGLVMSEEGLLLGRVSLELLGLGNVAFENRPRIGRSSDGPEFGIAHHFWAGPPQ